MAIPRLKPPSFLARFWFPLCLIGLLFIAIPGIILFALNLYGQDGEVNQWLEKAYQLSYHILIPWWGGLLLLLIPIFLLLLYFLKLKRKPLSVPSTFLWKKSIEDLHVNSLLQWLRQNVLLLLQLLALLAMIYGIMAFRFHGNRGEGTPYILMIDNSASMSTTDVEPNRLEWAKHEALKEIDAHSEQDPGMVIVFNSSAEIQQSFTGNKQLLRNAVKKIEPTQRPTRIEEALSLAESLATPLRSTENVSTQPENPEFGKERTNVPTVERVTDVHLFSDGRFPDLSEAFLANLNSRLAGNTSALKNLNMHFHLAGNPGPDNVDNVALVTFNALRDERDPNQVQVFVRALNFRTRETITKVRLEVFENYELTKVYEKPLNLRARRRVEESAAKKSEADIPDIPEDTATFDLNAIDPGKNIVLHAKLMDLRDSFPLDDEAWLVINVPRKARVLIVGGLNEALDKFFTAEEVLEVAQVDQLTPKDLAEDTYRKAARNGTYDLIIFDRCAPATEKDMPRSNTFFIGLPPPPFKKEKLEVIANAAITGWTSSHPVLRDLRALYTIGIGEAYKIKKEDLPPRTLFLIEARRIATDQNIDLGLLFTLSRESFTDLVMTFPLRTEDGNWNTNFWLQTSFPLFLRNVLFHLGNLNDSPTEESVQPGMVKKIRPEENIKQLSVTGPNGREHTVSHEDRESRTDFTFGQTEQVGVYRIKWDGKMHGSFPVNLLDAEESNIEPRSSFQIGTDSIVAGQERGQPRDLWKWFALAALIILLVEWYIYNRRIYV